MTRPPRPKYPSDSKNYHELRRPGCAHTIRLPEELLPTYNQLKRCLGPRSTHADVIRFLFEAAEPAIQATIQADSIRVVADLQDADMVDDIDVADPDDDPGDVAADSEESDEETASEAGLIFAGLNELLAGDSHVETVPDVPYRVFADATNAFWAKTKVKDFFNMFPVACPTEGCGRVFLPPKISEFQQTWSLGMKCPVGHSYSFLTGELEKNHGIPYVTGRLYHASLCAGMTHSCLESMCEELGLHVPRKAHFFEFQSGKRRKPGWISAALGLWDDHKNTMHEELLRKGKPLVLYVDCRFDSSRSGFHGTLPVINVEDDIEMVTLTREQTRSSWRIETQALEQALSTLLEKRLVIEEIIHDDNVQVDAIIAQHNIMSQKDLWHKCKNVMAKFKDLLQEKRRNPNDQSVEAATTIAQVAVFSVAQLKEYCREHGLPQSGSKLQLVQRVSVDLKLAEAGATTEIQRQRPLKYPELASHDIAYKLKSWIYTCCKNAAIRGDTSSELLTLDIHNAADHWAGNHATCRTLPGLRKCVTENWTGAPERKYPEGGETHQAVKAFLKKYITEKKMMYYIRARENYLSETFHSVINKYATKRIHFDASHTARLACAALDWNENIRREVRAVYNHTSNDTAVRRRARTNRVLADRTSAWKTQLAGRVFT